MTDTLNGQALGGTVRLPPSGTVTLTLDVSTSADPDISARDVRFWFQPRSLGAPDESESLVAVTRDYDDAATGFSHWSFDAGELWTAVGSSTVRGLIVDGDDLPWYSLLVVLDLDGTETQTALTLPAVFGGALELIGTLSTVAGGKGDAGADGKTVLSGAGAPDDGTDGVDGDFWIDTDEPPTLYGPKAAGVWPAGVSMVGPAGLGSGDVIGPASATDNAVALFDGTTGKLVKDSTTVLGTSAPLDVGTTTGTVAAGDDSRLSDARTPTAHKTSHNTGGSDAITSLAASVIDSGTVAVAQGGTNAGTAGAARTNLGVAATNNTATSIGATKSIAFATDPASIVHDMTMNQNCTFSFTGAPSSGTTGTMTLILRGAFTPTLPASIKWAGGSAPTYGSPSVYEFVTVDGGVTCLGFLAGAGIS